MPHPSGQSSRANCDLSPPIPTCVLYGGGGGGGGGGRCITTEASFKKNLVQPEYLCSLAKEGL